MDDIDKAIDILDNLQKDIEKYYIEQDKIIRELKEALTGQPNYPDDFTSEQEQITSEEEQDAFEDEHQRAIQ